MTRHLPSVAAPVALAAGALLLLAACADPDAGEDPAGAPDLVSDPSADGQRYRTVATVLESPDHGPQLCYAVADSYPPQCGGPEVVGWDWDAVESESASGTTWGSYTLVGTWDGERFTLTEPARPADPADSAVAPEPDFSTPCPEPEGGWQAVDPGTATQDAMNEALARAEAAEDFAGAWVDQPAPGRDDPGAEQTANDPAELVLNLRFTGDLAQREQWIREVWGGALCVSGAEHTEAELRDIQQEIHQEVPNVQAAGVDVMANAVTVTVFAATPELQRELDQRYGEGTVQVHGLLQPVE